MTNPSTPSVEQSKDSIEYNRGYLDGIKKAVNLFTTHEEGKGEYCDTGRDMEWSCRSDCVELGLERCRKHWEEYTSSMNHD